MRVYQRGKRGTWWVDITVDGERVKRSAGTVDRAQAEEFAATLARDLWRAKRLGEAPRVTWDTAVIEWLAEHQHRKSLEEMKRILRWLSARLAGKALAEITDTVIRALTSERKAQPVNQNAIDKARAGGKAPPAAGRATDNATVNRHLAQLSTILHYANRRGWLPALPPIAKLHEPAKRVVWITREQADRLLEELPDHLRPMAGLALATGLRESNIRLLTWSQVDMARRVAWVYADQAKAGKNLNVPLNQAAMAVLTAQRGMHKRWVFPVPRWETGRDGRARQVLDSPTGKVSNHAWRKACIRAGLPTLRFHDLRHTWASWHVQSGTPLAVLQELGGWASLTMVQKYAHLAASHVAAWADNIGCGPNSGTGSDQQSDAATSSRQKSESDQELGVGWLMGLEPTTTRITIRAHGSQPSKIKHLGAAKRRKTG